MWGEAALAARKPAPPPEPAGGDLSIEKVTARACDLRQRAYLRQKAYLRHRDLRQRVGACTVGIRPRSPRGFRAFHAHQHLWPPPEPQATT